MSYSIILFKYSFISFKILFDKYKDFDFVITIIPPKNNDLKTSALLSKPKSKLGHDTIHKMTENLLKHYELEKNSVEYIPYNFFMFVAPVIFYELLEYKYDDNFRNSIDLISIKDKDNNIITLNLNKFKEYNCGLVCVKKYLKFYGCNMDHHHGKNMHKHWSNIQKTQKLFI